MRGLDDSDVAKALGKEIKDFSLEDRRYFKVYLTMLCQLSKYYYVLNLLVCVCVGVCVCVCVCGGGGHFAAFGKNYPTENLIS